MKAVLLAVTVMLLMLRSERCNCLTCACGVKRYCHCSCCDCN